MGIDARSPQPGEPTTYPGLENRISTHLDRLNTDENHPAREWTDTFYLDEESRTLLRTQTSNMEPRIMEPRKRNFSETSKGQLPRKPSFFILILSQTLSRISVIRFQ